jgi:phosphoglycerol transferase
MREPGPLSRPPAATTLLVAMLAVFVYMVLRNGGQYASVFSDEWSYSSFSRLMPFSETPVPSYLYYTVYRLSSSCGDGFLECARVLNALFFVAAMPFIYLLARQHMTRGTALLVALLAIAAPNNTYTSYFMPEAMYFFGFWAFSWSAVREGGAATLPKVALSASLLGLLAMVKVHALFLLPAYLAYLVYCAFAARAVEHPWWRRALLKVAVALVTAAAVRMAVGYLYAGSNGLYLFGTLYANQAQTRPGLDVLAGMALLNLRGHLMALALMFSMPLAAAALQAISRRQRGAAGAASSRLLAWSALMLPSLVVVTAVFTGLVAGSGSESGARLHMRYYDFALPLLLMLAGAALAPTAPAAAPPGWRRRHLDSGLHPQPHRQPGAVRLHPRPRLVPRAHVAQPGVGAAVDRPRAPRRAPVPVPVRAAGAGGGRRPRQPVRRHGAAPRRLRQGRPVRAPIPAATGGRPADHRRRRHRQPVQDPLLRRQP